MDWMREMISNLYKNKMGEKKSQNIRKKWLSVTVKKRVVGRWRGKKGGERLEEVERLGKM